MTERVFISLIEHLPSIISAIGVVIIGIHVKKLKEQTDGIQNELLKKTAKSSNLEGREQGRIKEVNREKET